MTEISVVKDDILNIDCDCVVVSANSKLINSRGVAAKLIDTSDKVMYDELNAIDKCSVGRARITKCYNEINSTLKWAIYAVPPRYAGGLFFEDDLLKDAIANSLMITSNLEKVYTEQCVEIMEKILDGLEQELPDDVRDRYIGEVKEVASEYVAENEIKKIAIQILAVGNLGYPLMEAVELIKRAISTYNRRYKNLEEIVLVCHNELVFKTVKRHFK